MKEKTRKKWLSHTKEIVDAGHVPPILSTDPWNRARPTGNTRIGHRLLKFWTRTGEIDSAFYAPYVDALSKATGIPRPVLSKLQGAPVDWILQDRRYCNVCIRCIESDVLTGMNPFLRVEWRQAWNTNCAIHGNRLLRTTLAFMADRVDSVKGARNVRGSEANLQHWRERWIELSPTNSR